MRDTIKSKEYFDEYILKMSEGIKRFEEGIAAGKYLNDKILFVKDCLVKRGMIQYTRAILFLLL